MPTRAEAAQIWRRASSLAKAARACDAARVRVELALGMDVNAADWRGYTALMWACLGQHGAREHRLQVVGILIEAGADPNQAANNGLTPLMLACLGGHDACVTALLDAGANPLAVARGCEGQDRDVQVRRAPALAPRLKGIHTPPDSDSTCPPRT